MQEAYIRGASTREVDDLVKALGMTGISKNRGSELCEGLDEEVGRFRKTLPLRLARCQLPQSLIVFGAVLLASSNRAERRVREPWPEKE